MKCPYCSNTHLKVTNKRNSSEGVRRRRECLKCGKRFTTYEKIEPTKLYVIKKDGQKEKFSREKLEKGVFRAFEKRPVSDDRLDKMIDKVEEMIRKKGKEVKSSYIGDLLMKKIEKLDKIAYVRFASIYKEFDVKDFKKEVRHL